MPIHAHRTHLNSDHLIGFDEKPTAKWTEKSSVSVSVLCGLNRPKPTDVFGKNRKTDRATFHFRFATLSTAVFSIVATYVGVLVPWECMLWQNRRFSLGLRGTGKHAGLSFLCIHGTRSTIEVAHFRYFVSERRGSFTPDRWNVNLDFGKKRFVDLGHGIIRRDAI